jgi:benzoate-CoA ligase family protein
LSRALFDPPEWFNMADYFLDRRVDEGCGERTALIVEGRRLTYRDVISLANRVAHTLRSLGVEREQRVLISLRDSPEYVAAFFGTLKMGGAVVMANPGLKPEELRYFMEYTRAKVVFAPADRAAAFAEAADGLDHRPRIVTSDEIPALLEGRDSAFRNEKTHRDDPAVWLFSGGTTGKPKAVVQTHLSFANTTELYAKRAIGYRDSDIAIGVPKLFFGYATGSVLLFPFAVGAAAVLFKEPPEATRLFELIREHQATVLINVPTFIKQMLQAASAAPETSRAALKSLRFATSAGEALPQELHRQWDQAFGVPLLDGLGTAEMWHIFITNRPEPGGVRIGTLGRAVEGFDVQLVDDLGREVNEGEIGALRVRGRSRALGYFQNLDRTAAAFEGEWYRTGDMLSRDALGVFSYAGRGDDLLKIGGRWLSPGEVEDCLLKRKEVREAAVTGFSDASGLVKPMAFVTLDPQGGVAASASLAESLKEYVRATLEPYKSPREIVFLETMPRTHLGKIDRGELKRRANATRA